MLASIQSMGYEGNLKEQRRGPKGAPMASSRAMVKGEHGGQEEAPQAFHESLSPKSQK